MAEKGEKRRSVKQRIRDTKRLLSKEDLPETVRLSKERVLKCLATELQEQQQVVRDKKMNKKYRMVKFFDKRKVMRRLKVLQREWSITTDHTRRRELLLSLKQLRKELNYIVHYPATEKYLALYPSTESTDRQALERKDDLLGQVAEMVASGELTDASSSFLPPDLIAQLCSQTSGKEPVHSSLTAVTQRVAVGSDISEDKKKESVKQVKALGKRRKRICKAAVDEEPEGGLEAKRHLATEDDFFLPRDDSASS